MLQLNLGGITDYMPTAVVTSPTARTPITSPLTSRAVPATATQATRTGQPACGYGYAHGPNGVCMSQGCFDGRSPCVVMDGYGQTCSYDQYLAVGSACGPAPRLPAPPIVPSVPGAPNVTPGIPVDVSPSPGVQATAVVPAEQIPGMQPRIPRWALVIGGLSILAIIAALIARR